MGTWPSLCSSSRGSSSAALPISEHQIIIPTTGSICTSHVTNIRAVSHKGDPERHLHHHLQPAQDGSSAPLFGCSKEISQPETSRKRKIKNKESQIDIHECLKNKEEKEDKESQEESSIAEGRRQEEKKNQEEESSKKEIQNLHHHQHWSTSQATNLLEQGPEANSGKPGLLTSLSPSASPPSSSWSPGGTCTTATQDTLQGFRGFTGGLQEIVYTGNIGTLYQEGSCTLAASGDGISLPVVDTKTTCRMLTNVKDGRTKLCRELKGLGNTNTTIPGDLRYHHHQKPQVSNHSEDLRRSTKQDKDS